MRRLVSALSLVVALAACQPAAPTVDLAADEQAILAQVAVLNAAFAAYDETAIATVYSPDALILPPNQEQLSGTALIEQFFAGMEQLKASMTLTPIAVEVAAAGDVAVELGTWAMSLPTPDGGTFQDNGKYVVTWEKTGGAWLIQTDIWNSDNAPPAAAK